MFGYVRPLPGELKVKDWEGYRGVYCGLCATLGKRCGFLSRFTLNYDFTFLAMLLADGTCEKTTHRCLAHPFRRRNVCYCGKGMELAADQSIILTYLKLRDNVSDSGFFKGLPSRVGCTMLGKAYRKAAAQQSEFDCHVTQQLARLTQMEGEGCTSIDRTADAFALLLQHAAPTDRPPGECRALTQLLYHLGRWIYLVDALDDIEEDRASGSYNPLIARFGDIPDRDALGITLQHSRSIACSAFQLLPPSPFQETLSNILYQGLPAVEGLVFSGKWRKAEKSFRSSNT